jgi:hypothetical protein
LARCAKCNTLILFGGVKDAGRRYCSVACHNADALARASQLLPDEAIDGHLLDFHEGPCPMCKGPGPVDVYTSHFVWSAIVFTRHGSQKQVSCRGCARRRQLRDTLTSALGGWWGFPWGLLMTPVQLVRNIMEMNGGPSPDLPSKELEQYVRLSIAHQVASTQHAERISREAQERAANMSAFPQGDAGRH